MYSCVIGSKEYEVFIDNYSKLTTILKLSFNNMIPHFVTERIISPDERSIKVEDFLGKITTCLEGGRTENFHALLRIMKHYGNWSDEELASAMVENLSLK